LAGLTTPDETYLLALALVLALRIIYELIRKRT
jgi:hypothetical protein